VELLLVGLIVVVTSLWLGLKAYRFFRSALKPRKQGAPPCTACPACTQDMLACDGSEDAPCGAMQDIDINKRVEEMSKN
jgi:hypothetical protein